MGIKGLDDVIRVPRLGKIHLGIKNPTGGYPQAVDYFVVNQDDSTPADVYENFKAKYGDKPKQFDITFHSEDIDECFPRWFKRYSMNKGLVCKGDGNTASLLDDTSGDWSETDCKGYDCEDYISKKCRRLASLKFCLPMISGLGIWQIDTGSINSIINIQSSFKLIQKSLGRIAGVMLKLTLVPTEKTITFENKEHKQVSQKKTFYILKIDTDKSLFEIMKEKNTQPDSRPAVVNNNIENKKLTPTKDEIATPEDFPPAEEVSAIAYNEWKTKMIKAKTLSELKDYATKAVQDSRLLPEHTSMLDNLYSEKSSELESNPFNKK